jgi:hypothetical protein
MSIRKSNTLFHRRRAPILAPIPRHRKPPPSRALVREAREATWQAAHRPLRVAGSGRASSERPALERLELPVPRSLSPATPACQRLAQPCGPPGARHTGPKSAKPGMMTPRLWRTGE